MFKKLLSEMPVNLRSVGSLYKIISNLVNAAENMEVESTKVAHNIYKIVDNTHALYYYQDNAMLISGVFMTKGRNGSLKVSATGKHPSYIGRAPYTIDLYRVIINDLSSKETLFSDTNLTDDSIKIWKRLAKDYPGRVMIYDKTTKEVEPISNPGELNRAVGISPNMAKYQFMIRGQRGAVTERIQQLAGIKGK